MGSHGPRVSLIGLFGCHTVNKQPRLPIEKKSQASVSSGAKSFYAPATHATVARPINSCGVVQWSIFMDGHDPPVLI